MDTKGTGVERPVGTIMEIQETTLLIDINLIDLPRQPRKPDCKRGVGGKTPHNRRVQRTVRRH